ncbi:hypothetical protein SAMN05216503_1117 [Polaribacter sp. KT25b]|nr:hypothetical protein SAMN05216503_1117 [Polaribacter sp. KT25b]
MLNIIGMFYFPFRKYFKNELIEFLSILIKKYNNTKGLKLKY